MNREEYEAVAMPEDTIPGRREWSRHIRDLGIGMHNRGECIPGACAMCRDAS